MYTKMTTGPVESVGDNRVRALISAETEDRDGEVLLAAGMDATAYLRNPVVLWAHDTRIPPIGKCVELKPEPGIGVWAVDEFAPTPFGQEVKQLYKGGFLSAFSVGFGYVADGLSDTRPDGSAGRTITRWEVYEHSGVAVPANADALAVAEKDGIGAAGLLLKALYPQHPTEEEQVADYHRRLKGALEWLRNRRRHAVKVGALPDDLATLHTEITPLIGELFADLDSPEPTPAPDLAPTQPTVSVGAHSHALAETHAQLKALRESLADLQSRMDQAAERALAEQRRRHIGR